MELCSGFGWFIRGPLLVGAVTTPVLTGLHTSGAGLCERPGERWQHADRAPALARNDSS